MPPAVDNTLALIRARRALGLHRPRRAMPSQRHPVAIEASYATALVKQLDRAREAMQPLLDEVPIILAEAKRERGDSLRWDAGAGQRAREAVKRARERLRAAMPTSAIESVAARFATQTQTNQRIQLGNQLHRAIGIDVVGHAPEVPNLGAMVQHFISENTSLITTIPEDMLSHVDRLLQRGITSGMPVEQLRGEISERFDIGKRHARVIARDQVGKLFGQVNKVRQRALGIDSFVWETANDERVRDEHQVLNGRTFAWATGAPVEGIPGEPIQCRCTGQPVLDKLLAALG